ncbi:hypothetical protein LY16_00734 [Xenorhabdus doucetiae]|uniref:Uncharacterized protein n=1 Tax=Xenorhabdus doucetiae TaxID=351671 RepID=A0ABY3NVZ4_9GAMM|nr:hypothetical protein LY16_00734 [Xenorhabdus doucetiae]
MAPENDIPVIALAVTGFYPYRLQVTAHKANNGDTFESRLNIKGIVSRFSLLDYRGLC